MTRENGQIKFTVSYSRLMCVAWDWEFIPFAELWASDGWTQLS